MMNGVMCDRLFVGIQFWLISQKLYLLSLMLGT